MNLSRKNIIITGAQASGKTTLGHYLTSVIPKSVFFDEVMSRNELEKLTNEEHRIVYSYDFFETVIVAVQPHIPVTGLKYAFVINLKDRT